MRTRKPTYSEGGFDGSNALRYAERQLTALLSASPPRIAQIRPKRISFDVTKNRVEMVVGFNGKSLESTLIQVPRPLRLALCQDGVSTSETVPFDRFWATGKNSPGAVESCGNNAMRDWCGCTSVAEMKVDLTCPVH